MDIAGWITTAILCAVILVFAIIKIAQFFAMTKEERIKKLISYIKGLVADAEQAYGAGMGKEKLAEVEKNFKEKTPIFYKIILKTAGGESLEALIEKALTEIKISFEK